MIKIHFILEKIENEHIWRFISVTNPTSCNQPNLNLKNHTSCYNIYLRNTSKYFRKKYIY